jgi:hypothetical protein
VKGAFVGAALAALNTLTSTAPRFQRFVTIAIRPSSGGGMDGGNHIFLENGSNIFFAGRLDTDSDKEKLICPSGHGATRR